MDLFSNRIRFNSENRLSRTTIPFTLKTSGRSCVRKWRVSSKRAIASSPRVLAKETSIYALITVPWIYFKCFPLISPRSIYLNSKRTLSQFEPLYRQNCNFFKNPLYLNSRKRLKCSLTKETKPNTEYDQKASESC